MLFFKTQILLLLFGMAYLKPGNQVLSMIPGTFSVLCWFFLAMLLFCRYLGADSQGGPDDAGVCGEDDEAFHRVRHNHQYRDETAKITIHFYDDSSEKS